MALRRRSFPDGLGTKNGGEKKEIFLTLRRRLFTGRREDKTGGGKLQGRQSRGRGTGPAEEQAEARLVSADCL